MFERFLEFFRVLNPLVAGSRSKVSAKSLPDLRESKLEREVAPVKVVKLNEREANEPKTLIEETEKIETKKVRRDSKSGQQFELGSKVTKGRRHRGAWMGSQSLKHIMLFLYFPLPITILTLNLHIQSWNHFTMFSQLVKWNRFSYHRCRWRQADAIAR